MDKIQDAGYTHKSMTHYESLRKNFILCYNSEVDAVLRFCLVRVRDREQALDIVQETFARMWQTLYKGEKISNERAFLFTIVCNDFLTIQNSRIKVGSAIKQFQ